MLLPLNAELTLDPKGRVMVPRALRNSPESEGAGSLVAFANGGPQPGLAFYTVPDFKKLQQEHASGSPLDPQARPFPPAPHPPPAPAPAPAVPPAMKGGAAGFRSLRGEASRPSPFPSPAISRPN